MALHHTHPRSDPQGAQPNDRKDTSMTTRPSNKAIIDGIPRFIAYQCDHEKKKPHDRRCAVGAG
jgi:hypothetical protein